MFESIIARLEGQSRLLVGSAGLFLLAWLFGAVSVTTASLLFGGLVLVAMLASRDRSSQRIGTGRRARMTVMRDPPIATLLNRMPQPVVLASRQGRVRLCNNAAHTLFPALVAGRPLSLLLRDPEFLAQFDEAAEAGRSSTVVFVESHPVARRIRAHIVPIFDQGGDRFAEQVLIVFTDLTDQEALDQMRTDFIANASHELRTPLASVQGFIETLRGAAKDDAEAREKFLGIMSVQAERMSRLIDDLMSLSRVELNRHVLPRDTVDVAAILREVCDAMEPIAEEAGSVLQLARHGSAPLMMRGDRDELAQVFQNLIQNAIKYGPKDGVVRVGIERLSSDNVQISVSDDGIGIAAEHLPRLTERFYRVNTADSRERGGTGLGLAIVKHVVNRHRGSLNVVSEPRKGSTFSVTFKLVDDPSMGATSNTSGAENHAKSMAKTVT